ncbi:MAG: hypothetical protein AABY51_03680 [Deltaproteobacteria bacterium]
MQKRIFSASAIERIFKNIFLFAVCSLLLGCVYNVDFKTPDQYKYSTALPLNVGFHMNKTLVGQMYSGRAVSSGIANRWDVPVGKVTHDYAISYLKGGFTGFTDLDALDKSDGYDAVIEVTEINYYMQGQAAHSDITITAHDRSGRKLVDKKYHSDGPSGFGRVFAAGAFAQKSAIRQSTHVVMEKIFKDFMVDFASNFEMVIK